MQFLSQRDPRGQKILLRLDLDLPQDAQGGFDTTRLEDGLPTLEYLWQKQAASVTVIAHRGHHPTVGQEYSLAPIAELLRHALLQQPTFQGVTTEQLSSWLTVRENLRFDPREEQGSLEFAQELAAGHDLFVNDAFATAHRRHTSIVFLPKVLSTCFGLQFEKEYLNFQRLFATPARPFLFILGGAKLETKLPLLEEMAKQVDVILVGGKLAVEASQHQLTYSPLLQQKMIIATVTQDTLDISNESATEFAQKIATAKTIVWNGPMGKFEDGTHAAGTRTIAEAVAAATRAAAFSLIGGGDTEAALTVLNLEQPGNFSHISSGGGAMMEYLAKRTLPAIEETEQKKTHSERTSMHTFGINGFGRIGRTAFRVWWLYHRDRIDLKVINTSGSMPVKDWVHLLKYDSNYGPFAEPITFTESQSPKEATEANPVIGTLTIGGKTITITAQRDPAKIPWGANGVETVIESTGAFTSAEKAGLHLQRGAQRVIISAPAKGDVPTNVIGIGEPASAQQIISNASCTTNCITPVVAVMNQVFGVAKAMLTTVHSYTDDQNLHDNSHRDMRRARAAAMNLVPTSTGAAIATTQVIPELKNMFDGLSIRVPTAVGSISDMVFIVKRKTTVAEVQQALRDAAAHPHWAGILAVTDEPLVSRDIVGRRESSIVDLELTQVIDGDMVKVVAWYDNEFGYCNRLVEQVGR